MNVNPKYTEFWFKYSTSQHLVKAWIKVHLNLPLIWNFKSVLSYNFLFLLAKKTSFTIICWCLVKYIHFINVHCKVHLLTEMQNLMKLYWCFIICANWKNKQNRSLHFNNSKKVGWTETKATRLKYFPIHFFVIVKHNFQAGTNCVSSWLIKRVTQPLIIHIQNWVI